MGGRWQHRRRKGEHQRIRKALLPAVRWGITPCYRCSHPLEPGDRVDLDHADDGSYGGFSHRSPCRVCGQRCNAKAGGEKAALNAGKRLRTRACVICGNQFTASRGADGAVAATCGRTECRTALRRLRKAGEPDPEPPPQTGRTWLFPPTREMRYGVCHALLGLRRPDPPVRRDPRRSARRSPGRAIRPRGARIRRRVPGLSSRISDRSRRA